MKDPIIFQATCSVTARIMCGCVLHNAATGTAPALKAISAVSDGEEMPIEKRWQRHSRRSSKPFFFPFTRACLCQERPRSPPPLGSKNKSPHVFSYSTKSTWRETLPDVAVRQSPALLQQQPHLWPELHVEILAISTINMDEQWHLSQISHGQSVKQCYWHSGTILERQLLL